MKVTVKSKDRKAKGEPTFYKVPERTTKIKIIGPKSQVEIIEKCLEHLINHVLVRYDVVSIIEAMYNECRPQPETYDSEMGTWRQQTKEEREGGNNAID